MRWLKREILTRKEMLILVLLSTVIFGLMAHAFGFLNLNLNHDYVNEYNLYGVMGWKLTIGRFMMPVVGVILGAYIAMPWFSGIFALVMIALSVCLILRMFSLNQRWQAILLSGILVTNLAITALAASFMGDMVSDTFGLFLAVLAAYLWCKMRDGSRLKTFVFCVMLVAVSLGCYQSHLSIAITLMAIKMVEDLLAGKHAAGVLRSGLRGALSVLAGVILYFLIANIVCAMNGLSLASGTTNSLSNVWAQDGSIISRVFYTYIYVFWSLFAPAISPIPTSSNMLPFSSATFHTYIICGINLLIFVLLVASLFVYMHKTKMRTSARLLILVLLLGLPFLMNTAHFLSGYSHVLMQLPFALYYLLFMVVMVKVVMDKRMGFLLKRIFGYMAVSLAAVVLVQIEYANVVYTKKEVESSATLSMMTRVLALVEAQDGYVFGETTVCPIGANPQAQSALRGAEDIAGITGVEANSAISYQGVYQAYFQNVLLYPVGICTTAQLQDLEKTVDYAEMGVFPDRDSIKMINDIVVIKMLDD